MIGEGPSSRQMNLQTVLLSTPTLNAPQLLTAVNIQPMKVLLSWFPPVHPPVDIVSHCDVMCQ